MKKLILTFLSLSVSSSLFAAEADPVSKIKLGLRFGTGALNDITNSDANTLPLDRICLQVGRVTAIMRRTRGSNPLPPDDIALKAIQYENFCGYITDPENKIPRGQASLMAENLYGDFARWQAFVNDNSPTATAVAAARAEAAPQNPQVAEEDESVLNEEEKEMLGKLESVLKLAKGVQNNIANAQNAEYPFDSMCLQLGRVTAMLRRAGKNTVIRKAFAKNQKDYNKDEVLQIFKEKAAYYEYFCGYITSENQKDLGENPQVLRGYLTANAKKKLIEAAGAEAPRKHYEEAAKALVQNLEEDSKKLDAVIAPLRQ